MNHHEPMTRSDFLRGGFKSLLGFVSDFAGRQAESRTRKMVVPLLRPPGAVQELSFLTKCTRCDLCMKACPHEAIIKAPAKYGAAVDTPMIAPADAPCYLCADTPCIAVCPEGALLPAVPVKMGTAYLILSKCFAYNRQVDLCDYCFDRCPLKGEAIIMEERKPRIIADKCVGCGLCEYFCPASGCAIKVLPERA